MSAALTLSMDDETLARLDGLASAREMSREALLQVALTDYLDTHGADARPPLQDWQLQEIEEGLEAADRGEFATDEEVEAVFSEFRR